MMMEKEKKNLTVLLRIEGDESNVKAQSFCEKWK